VFERFIARQAKVMDAVLGRPLKEIVGELALSVSIWPGQFLPAWPVARR
jgi:hypothetical protein